MKEIQSMMLDKREIRSVAFDEAMTDMWIVGKDGVTAIVCYAEYGEYSHVPFLAIYIGDIISERANALKFRIIYKVE